MKKFLPLLLAAVLLLALTACESNTAYSLYNKVNKNMEEITSLEMDTHVSVSMGITGELTELFGNTADITMKGVTRQVYLSDTEVQQEMVMEMDALGQTMQIVSYYQDGYFYQRVTGTLSVEFMGETFTQDIDEKQKIRTNLDQVSRSGGMLFSFNDEGVKESSLTELEGGASEITFVLDGEAVGSSALSILGEMEELYREIGADLSEMSLSDISMSMVANKDNQLDSMSMAFDATFPSGSEITNMSFNIQGIVNSINQLTSIDYPSDLDTY